MEVIKYFKSQMSKNFEMTDLGKLNYYLGIKVEQEDGCIKLRQTGYAKKIIEKAGMKGCNSTKYPMDPKEQIDKDERGKTVDVTQYKSTIGGLRYLVHTRPILHTQFELLAGIWRNQPRFIRMLLNAFCVMCKEHCTMV